MNGTYQTSDIADALCSRPCVYFQSVKDKGWGETLCSDIIHRCRLAVAFRLIQGLTFPRPLYFQLPLETGTEKLRSSCG